MSDIATLSAEQARARMNVIHDELERLARFEKPTRPQERQATELHLEFDELSEHVDNLERNNQLDRIRSAVTGGADNLRIEGGSTGMRDGNVRPAPAQRLGSEHSVSDWLTRHCPEIAGGRTGDPLIDGSARDLDVNAALGSYFRGVFTDDWRDWRSNYETRAMGSGEPGGGYLIPDMLASAVIDRMRAQNPIMAAGARTVPMTSSTLDIARITGDPTASWHTEGATITPSDVTLDRIRFTARSLPVIVKASVELADDAPNLGEVVARAMAAAIAGEVTRVALRGSGVAPEPMGIRNATGVTLTALGANGGAVSWSTLITAVRDILAANAVPGALIWHPRTAMALAASADTTGQFIPPPEPVAVLNRLTTTRIPTDIAKGTGTNLTEVYVGDFTQLLIGTRTNLRLRRLDERYADTGEIAFMVYPRLDIQLEHGPAFNVITDASN